MWYVAPTRGSHSINECRLVRLRQACSTLAACWLMLCWATTRWLVCGPCLPQSRPSRCAATARTACSRLQPRSCPRSRCRARPWLVFGDEKAENTHGLHAPEGVLTRVGRGRLVSDWDKAQISLCTAVDWTARRVALGTRHPLPTAPVVQRSQLAEWPPSIKLAAPPTHARD
jgi:hypothetical protein